MIAMTIIMMREDNPTLGMKNCFNNHPTTHNISRLENLPIVNPKRRKTPKNLTTQPDNLKNLPTRKELKQKRKVEQERRINVLYAKSRDIIKRNVPKRKTKTYIES